jgi:hypothetical protein
MIDRHRFVPGREAEVLEAAGAPAQRPLFEIAVHLPDHAVHQPEVAPVVLFEERVQELADGREVFAVVPRGVVELALQRLRAAGRRPAVVVVRLLEHLDARAQVEREQLVSSASIERMKARRSVDASAPVQAESAGNRVNSGAASRSSAAVIWSGVASSSSQAESSTPIAFTVKQSSASGSAGSRSRGRAAARAAAPRSQRRIATSDSDPIGVSRSA